MKDSEFQREVAHTLRKAGIPFQSQVAIGGLQPDFAITTPEGRVIVVEAKGWERLPGFAARAEKQAEHYRELAGADAAFVVVKSLERSRRSAGVVTIDDLADALREEISRRTGKAFKRSPLKVPKKTIFAAMPFALEYEDTFFVAKAPSAKSVGAVCRRVDQEEYVGDVVERIQEMIRNAAAVIADLSEARPNVFYEAGYAWGRRKIVVPICSTPIKELPFDVSHWNGITYVRGQTHRLKNALSRRLKAVLT